MRFLMTDMKKLDIFYRCFFLHGEKLESSSVCQKVFLATVITSKHVSRIKSLGDLITSPIKILIFMFQYYSVVNEFKNFFVVICKGVAMSSSAACKFTLKVSIKQRILVSLFSKYVKYQ